MLPLLPACLQPLAPPVTAAVPSLSSTPSTLPWRSVQPPCCAADISACVSL
jgi:hypothetical protein